MLSGQQCGKRSEELAKGRLSRRNEQGCNRNMKRSASESSFSEGCPDKDAADYFIDEDEEETALLAASILADLASTPGRDADDRGKTLECCFEDSSSSDSDDDDDASEAGLSGLFRSKMTTKDEVSACSTPCCLPCAC